MTFVVKAFGGFVSHRRVVSLCRVEANSEEEAASKLRLEKKAKGDSTYRIPDVENSPGVFLHLLGELPPLVEDYSSLRREFRKAERKYTGLKAVIP